MFNIFNELVEIPINDRLSQQTKEHVVGTIRPINIFELIYMTLGQNSFWHQTIPDWNSLLAAESKTVAAFKSQLVD